MLFLENLISEGLSGSNGRDDWRRRIRRGRRLRDRGLGSPRLAHWRRGRRPLFLRCDVDAARLEGRGEVPLGLDQALLLPREPLAFRREPGQLLSEGVLQFDEGFVLS